MIDIILGILTILGWALWAQSEIERHKMDRRYLKKIKKLQEYKDTFECFFEQII